MKNKKILVISDNLFLLKKFIFIVNKKKHEYVFDFGCSANFYEALKSKVNVDLRIVSVKRQTDFLINNYQTILSLHCQQIFPKKLVRNCKCINVHPGYNPFNRGWYPHVFSLINGLPAGATIHEMDEFVDNGSIIVQDVVAVEPDDTSLTLYKKIQETEIDLLSKNLWKILKGEYTTFKPKIKGNLNTKKDYEELCVLNLSTRMSVKNILKRLRALSHGDFNNAYYVDDSGDKIFVSAKFVKEKLK